MGAKALLPGHEILVLYSGGYFGLNRVNCQCPDVEFHVAEPYAFAAKTRSGSICADKDYSDDEPLRIVFWTQLMWLNVFQLNIS